MPRPTFRRSLIPALTQRGVRITVTLPFIALGGLDATWSSRLPLIRQRMSLSDLELSIALIGPAIGLILAARITPAIIDRAGSKRTAGAALVLSALTLPPLAVAPSLVLLTLALTAWGVCLGILDIAMNTHGTALELQQGSSLLSGLHAGYSGGVLLFAFAGSLAAHTETSPLVHFSAVALAIVAVCGPASWAMPPVPTRAPDPGSDREAGRAGPAWRQPQLLRLAAIGLCAMLAEGAVVNWSGVLLRQQDHSSLATAPLGLMAFSAGMVIGRSGGDRVIERLGHLRAVTRAAVLAAAGMLLAATGPSVTLGVAGYAVLGLGLSVLVPVTFALASRQRDISPVRALSSLTTTTYVGLFVGPPLIGLLSALIGLRGALACLALLLMIVCAASARWSRAIEYAGGQPGDVRREAA